MAMTMMVMVVVEEKAASTHYQLEAVAGRLVEKEARLVEREVQLVDKEEHLMEK